MSEIQRYKFCLDLGANCHCDEQESEDGVYVLDSDQLAAIKQLEAESRNLIKMRDRARDDVTQLVDELNKIANRDRAGR